MKWIAALVTFTFTVIGIFILILGFSMSASHGSELYRRALEFKFLGLFFILSPWISLFFLELRFRKERSFVESVLDSGTRRRAVLIGYQETGTYVNNSPQMSLIIQITDEDGTRRDEVFTGVVPLINASGLRPGMELEITESDRGMVINWA